MVEITHVEERSRAREAGILAHDILISINGNEINDVLDYRFYLAERVVEIEYERRGKRRVAKIKKDEYDDVGLEFETPLMDEKHSCKNAQCTHCATVW